MKKTVLITGASGNIGRKLSDALCGAFDLRLLDRTAGSKVLLADLSDPDPHWTRHFRGVDTVIHLAGEMRPDASWADCYLGNVISTRNVLAAAQAAGVRRVIFASSNQIMAGYRFLNGPVLSDGEPKPLNPYAISKLICEELGNTFTEQCGSSFIALRIGYLQAGRNVPSPSMGIGLWGQQMWLSDRDAIRAFELAILAEGVGFEVLNLVSDNAGTRWDMTRTREYLGFVAQDGHRPELSAENLAEDALARKARLIPGCWLDQYFGLLT